MLRRRSRDRPGRAHCPRRHFCPRRCDRPRRRRRPRRALVGRDGPIMAGPHSAGLVPTGRRGQLVDDRVQQVARPPPVQRRHGPGRGKAQGHELPDVGLAGLVVDFVDSQHHRPPRTHEQASHLGVLRRRANGHIDDEDNDVCLPDGAFSLGRHELVEGQATYLPPARVDQGELPARPLRVQRLAVTGNAGAFFDDRLPPPHDPVDQRRLAHIGPPHDGHDRTPRLGLGLCLPALAHLHTLIRPLSSGHSHPATIA